jgi:NAD(P)H-hydrate epimerase
VGELQVVGIGLDNVKAPLPTWEGIRRRVAESSKVRNTLPKRSKSAHKGTFGTALVVAGSINYTGAAVLAGKAAYRVGAGLVTVAIPEPLYTALAGHFPEATWLILPDEMGVIAGEAARVLLQNLERPTAMLIGPGIGLEDETREFLNRLFGPPVSGKRVNIGFVTAASKDTEQRVVKLPGLVIDADGLSLARAELG